MANIFLSYRRADPVPNWHVKKIGKMCADCGFDEVFVDRDQGAIPPGSNYRIEIEKAIKASDVVLVLIGERWQALLDEKADDTRDMVRFEIGRGLELGKTVVPLLLGGEMPGIENLPEELHPFHYCKGESFAPDTLDEKLPSFLEGLSGNCSRQSRNIPAKISHAATEDAVQIVIEVENDRLAINGYDFTFPSTIDDACSVLGPFSRMLELPHEGNPQPDVVCIWDRIGLTVLLDCVRHDVIENWNIWFDLSPVSWETPRPLQTEFWFIPDPPQNVFQGSLSVNGHLISETDKLENFSLYSGGNLSIWNELPGLSDAPHCYVAFQKPIPSSKIKGEDLTFQEVERIATDPPQVGIIGRSFSQENSCVACVTITPLNLFAAWPNPPRPSIEIANPSYQLDRKFEPLEDERVLMIFPDRLDGPIWLTNKRLCIRQPVSSSLSYLTESFEFLPNCQKYTSIPLSKKPALSFYPPVKLVFDDWYYLPAISGCG